MNKISTRLAVAAAALGLVAAFGVAAVVSKSGSRPAEAATNIDGPATFDPVAEALGVKNSDDLSRLQHLQQARADALSADYAEKAGNGQKPDGVHAAVSDPVSDALDASLSDLYSQVAATPKAAALQDEWRKCMATSGHPADSPSDVEEQILKEASSQKDDPTPGASIIKAREACDQMLAASTSVIVQDLFPGWLEANRQVIEQYASALGY